MAAAKPLSENAFRRLVRTLSADELRRFPHDRLPSTVPLDAVNEADDPRKRAALDELAWTVGARDLRQRTDAAERLEPAVLQALETAETLGDQGVDELNRLTDELVRQRRAAQATGETALPGLERARGLAWELGRTVQHLEAALDVLERPFIGREAFQDRVSAARTRAKDVLGGLESALGRYHVLEMELARGDMSAKRAQCEHEAARLLELDDQIRAVRAKLDQHSRMSRRLLRPRVARREREHLLERLQVLTRERDGCETYISEDDLLNWLDVVVNASLHVPPERWDENARHARLLLYRLMNVYCLQQETAAQQVATSAFLRTDARGAIDFYLGSEQFILQYFSRKRQEVTQWVAGAAADRLGQLDRIRDTILGEYRRQARRR